MTPSLPIPTDNIYKFACLFGLALIVSSIFSFVSTYTSSLDKSIKFSEAVIILEANAQRSKAEDKLLIMYKKMNENTKSNQESIGVVILTGLFFGIGLSIFGARMWYPIQERDDRLAELQLKKLEFEVKMLRSEYEKSTFIGPRNTSTKNEG